MIEKIIGEAMKISSFRYNEEKFHFEVECVMPGQHFAGVYTLNKSNFPTHTPFTILDEKVQIGEILHVWIKQESELLSEGWKANTKNTISNALSPFRIGKNKKPYLGGAHKAIVGIDSKFRPFVRIKDFRFSPNELKCVLKSDMIFQGQTARLASSIGEYVYNADNNTLHCPEGMNLGKETINNLIDLFRRAKLI